MPEQLEEIGAEMHAEIMMHVIRLMRSGNYKSAVSVRKAVESDFPDIPRHQIAQVMSDTARRLLAAFE